MFLHTLRFQDEQSATAALAGYRSEDGWLNNVFTQTVVLSRAVGDFDDDSFTPSVMDERFYVSIVLPAASDEISAMTECRMIRKWEDKSIVYKAADWSEQKFNDSILEPLPLGFGYPVPPPRVRTSNIGTYQDSQTNTQTTSESEALRIAFLGIRANNQINMGVMRGDYRWHKDNATEDFEMNGFKMDAQDFIEWAASQI